jgi:formate--tetrahydrofolate ligase
MVQKFGVPTCVAINYFSGDTHEEIQSIIDFCSKININAFKCTNWSDGGEGIEKLSQHVAYLAEQNDKPFRPLYPNERSLWEKIKIIAKEIYRARDIEASAHVQNK